jgi:hypothetical protein
MSNLISLATAIQMTSLYRANKETILNVTYRNTNTLLICETFDRDGFDQLLAQTDCKKIRIYYSMKTNYQVRAVVVGVDSNDADILTRGTEKILDDSAVCPPICPSPSALNQ